MAQINGNGDNAIIVELRDVSKHFGEVMAVRDISLQVYKGEFLSLLGPSGCGKTTTLQLIAGFHEPTRGEVIIDGEAVNDVPAYLRGLGMVFQNYALFPHLTIFENIAFGLRMRKMPKAEIVNRVKEVLSLVKLSGYEHRYPRQLSGGQQQRVALARALVIRPKVLLLDEPLAALDKKLRDEMRVELKEIQRKLGVTTVFVTHDQQEALSLSDRIAVMNAGQIEQIATPYDIYENPRTKFVATFIGASNLFKARLISQNARTAWAEAEGLGKILISLDAQKLPGEPEHIEVIVRPERVKLVEAVDPEAHNIFLGRLTTLIYQGTHTEAHLILDSGRRVVAYVDAVEMSQPLQQGATVSLYMDPQHFLIV
ncbi:MAG: ABC transporter ATP-binding protein [Chloroflexi bacterium]|nr:ABC transporter ATP-binding protein [Chloroflexota bacterium]